MAEEWLPNRGQRGNAFWGVRLRWVVASIAGGRPQPGPPRNYRLQREVVEVGPDLPSPLYLPTCTDLPQHSVRVLSTIPSSEWGPPFNCLYAQFKPTFHFRLFCVPPLVDSAYVLISCCIFVWCLCTSFLAWIFFPFN